MILEPKEKGPDALLIAWHGHITEHFGVTQGQCD